MTSESQKLLNRFACALSNETIYGESETASMKRCREYAAKTQAAREALEAHIARLECAASPASVPEAMTSEQQPATQQDEVNEIPLSDMHGARLVKDDDGHWALMRDEALMRYLDRFERGFVDSAIIAAMSAKHEGAK